MKLRIRGNSIDDAEDRHISVSGFVLVGGKSSRMGQDKAQMILGGKKLFERAALTLGEICGGNISLVGAIHTDLDIAVVQDVEVAGNDLPRAPIVGLYTALATATSEWIAVLACDLPFVTGDLMTKLVGFCSDEFDAIVPVQPDATSQPLCALYRCERCLPVAEEMLKTGDFKLQRFLSRVVTRYVGFNEVAERDGSANFFLNINTPEDYERALRLT
jgi:molybdopterin-guanine dinucleotide biosynthesis protein A/molybdopterin-guanine dinucleotide biosynthesis protein